MTDEPPPVTTTAVAPPGRRARRGHRRGPRHRRARSPRRFAAEGARGRHPRPARRRRAAAVAARDRRPLPRGRPRRPGRDADGRARRGRSTRSAASTCSSTAPGILRFAPAARHHRRRTGTTMFAHQHPRDAHHHAGRRARSMIAAGARRQDHQPRQHGRQERRRGRGRTTPRRRPPSSRSPGSPRSSGAATASPPTALCPGYVLTEMGAAHPHRRRRRRPGRRYSPLGRLGEPADVAGVAALPRLRRRRLPDRSGRSTSPAGWSCTDARRTRDLIEPQHQRIRRMTTSPDADRRPRRRTARAARRARRQHRARAPARRPPSTARRMSPIITEQLPLGLADLVAFPTERRADRAVVGAAVRHGVPITPRGKGTGNYGQAIPMARRPRARHVARPAPSSRSATASSPPRPARTMVALEQAARQDRASRS